MACYSADDQSDCINFYDAFMYNHSAWMYIGMKKSLNLRDAKQFIIAYSDKITDGKKTYDRAIEESVELMDVKNLFGFELYSWGRNGDYYDHKTREDKYRSIDRVENNEGETINRGETKYLNYYRNFDGTTNGGYFVFHGTLNNDPNDITSKADIKISVWRATESSYDLISQDTYYGLTNHFLIGDDIYGGSPVCSRLIEADDMNLVGTSHLKIIVKFERGTANNIYIDRFELMEIGK